jgi:hypothetical protein
VDWVQAFREKLGLEFLIESSIKLSANVFSRASLVTVENNRLEDLAVGGNFQIAGRVRAAGRFRDLTGPQTTCFLLQISQLCVHFSLRVGAQMHKTNQ